MRPWGKAPTIAVLVAIVGLYAAATWVPRARIARYDRQPIAAVVASIRGEAHAFGDPNDPAGRPLITATFGVSDRQMLSYDPRAVVVESVDELGELERQAAVSGARLVVSFCGGKRSESRDPAIHREVTGSGRYRRTGYVRGMESYFSYEIWERIEDAPGAG